MSWMESKTDWDEFAGMLHPRPGEKILDVGSGRGKVAAKVLEATDGAEVYAVDPSEKIIATMKREHPEVKGSVAPAEGLPYQDSEFDKAYTTMALHHYSDLDRALKEIARVLKIGGTLVILEVRPGSWIGGIFRFFAKVAGEHVEMSTMENLLAKLDRSGLFDVQKSASVGSRYLIQLTKR
jgi:ubiquinone/menaquinone biosynthesis C-methylase UbiE